MPSQSLAGDLLQPPRLPLKRTQVEDEEKLALVLLMLIKKAAYKAAEAGLTSPQGS